MLRSRAAIALGASGSEVDSGESIVVDVCSSVLLARRRTLGLYLILMV